MFTRAHQPRMYGGNRFDVYGGHGRERPALTLEQIEKKAPAIFADHAHDRVSAKYQHFNTAAMLQLLVDQGWEPFDVNQANVRDVTREGFQKHLIRLRRPNDSGRLEQLGHLTPNIILINASDATSSLQLLIGLWRKVCMNGLFVTDSQFEPVRFRHTGWTNEEVIEAQYRVVDDIPRMLERVNEFGQIGMTRDERELMAEAAIELRWPTEEKEDGTIVKTAPVQPRALLQTRRHEDTREDLFTTMNVIQENLIQGGLQGRTRTNGRTTTRAVQGVDSNVRLNKALWMLTERMASLKA